ncbi:hypothetical protein AFGD_004943 [Aspergillus flavus]|nr:hypothetical protein AFGD_004943 [Aspergillus flavus]
MWSGVQPFLVFHLLFYIQSIDPRNPHGIIQRDRPRTSRGAALEEDDLEQVVKNAHKWDIPELDKYGIISARSFLEFADWLVRGWVPTESTKGRDIYYILQIGSSMDKPSSINEAAITTFRNSPLFRVFESEGDAKNWTTFNKFFYRRLDNPRKIACPADDHIVAFPADSIFAGAYAITEDSRGRPAKERVESGER